MQSDFNDKKSEPVFSMTGYGEGEADLADGTVTVNVRTLNHDGTSVKVRGLGDDYSLAHKAEQAAQESFPRGRIQLKVEWEQAHELPLGRLEEEKVAASYDRLRDLAESLGLNEGPTFGDLVDLGLLESDPFSESAWPAIEQALREAIRAVREDQKREGEAIREDLIAYLSQLSDQLDEAEKDLPSVVCSYKERLRERIEKLLDEGTQLDEGRLEEEVSVFAEKVDVAEEISRARSHLSSAEETLQKGGTVGKKLKFIGQELHREINTLGAKSKNSQIQSQVIEMKLSLDKFKEQARNLA